MNEKTNSNQYQHNANANANAKSVPNGQPKPEEKTVCSRQKPSIPSLLRQVVPGEMKITPVGPGPDDRPIYMVTKELAYGTAEDIIKYLMENLLLSDPDVEAYISKAGAEAEGQLYAVTQFILGGTAGGIIEHFGC